MSSTKELSGAELDRVIAERVMRWTLADRRAMGWSAGPAVWLTGDEENPTEQDWHPSESIEAAMLVVEKMTADGFHWEFSCHNPVKSTCSRCPFADFWHYTNGVLDVEAGAEGATLPEAICRAALAAIGSKE